MSTAKRKRSTTRTSKKKMMLVSPADMVAPGFTRNNGTWGRYNNANCCRGELKWVDEQALYNIGPGIRNVIAQSFNVIPQNTSANGRIGQKVKIKSLGINFSAWMPSGVIPTGACQSHLLRMILVCDKQNNGVGFTSADLLHDPVVPLDPSAQSFRNLNNSGRFVVLSDTKYNLNYTGLAAETAAPTGFIGVSQTLISGTIWKDMNLVIEYNTNSAAGTLPDIRSNNLALVMVLESAPVPGVAGVSIFLNSRVRFED